MKIFAAMVCVCAVVNGIIIARDWYFGEAPAWFVWVFALAFCFEVLRSTLATIFGEDAA